MTTPDPLDAAAIRIVGDQLAMAAGVDAQVVPLSVAKAIRDQAVTDAISGAENALDEIADAPDDTTAELDTLYARLADVARAIARHLPEDTEAPETLTAGIKAVHDHAWQQGAAHAIGQLPPEAADLLDEIADAVDLEEQP